MLPAHRQRRPGWSEVQNQNSAASAAKMCFSRPSSKWFLFCFGFAASLWLLGPYVMKPPGPRNHPFHPFGEYDSMPPPPEPHVPPTSQTTLWSERAKLVKGAFVHAWDGYQKLAAPKDELAPVSRVGVDNFNGWGVSLVDGLDTMWIMGLHDQFQEAIPLVANMTFSLTEQHYAPFFETVIRYLGGLLSVYALSGEPVLLSRADDLGKMLLPAFNTTSGLPAFAINTVSGKSKQGWNGDTVLWAEALSCQMEYKYLAHLTGRTQYFDTVEKVMNIMYKANVKDGLFPSKWDLHTGLPTNMDYTVGAFADSAYEYLLKQWLMTGKSETKARDQYLKSVTGIIDNLLYLSPTRKLLYVTDMSWSNPTHVFEHLSCFLPGLLALGAHTLELSEMDKELHMWAAEGLAYTCYMTYADQPSGLGPDEMQMTPWSGDDHSAGLWIKHLKKWEDEGRPGNIPPGLGEVPTQPQDHDRDYSYRKTTYLLRPETVESFYILWKTTGDVHWRERGWQIFQAIERETRTADGYASVSFVGSSMSEKKDEMPSYFLAETLKYLYLLFSESDILPLDKWVFNTEAHPFPVYTWSAWEKHRYRIP